jgi:membrane dipeptidase
MLSTSNQESELKKPIRRYATIDFADLGTIDVSSSIDVQGWISPFVHEEASTYFALVEEAACCLGCLPRDAERRIEVFSVTPIAVTGGRVRLTGTLHRLADDDTAGWRYQLRDARLVESEHAHEGNLTRRRLLRAATLGTLAAAGAPAFAITAAASGASAPASPASAKPSVLVDTVADARAAIADMPTVDVHSHAGGVIGVSRVEGHAPFSPVADAMRDGGMAVLCLATVSDSPTHRILPDHRIRPFRDPAPGELQAYGERSFQRVHDFAHEQNLAILKTAADLAAARSSRPAIIVAAEGGDFLEGRPERVVDAYGNWSLRHLQLTHYRVNELGDIQTETPVHGGLTSVGAEVVKYCNALGIVVDVAHATYDMVRQVADVATRPLVLSHTSLVDAPGPRSRKISADHARIVAQTGGVIGIWPPSSVFSDLDAMAEGMARTADVVGVDHVALGSDMRGLTVPSVFASYQDLPLLAQAMLRQGFQAEDVRKVLGGNYLRVFRACVGEA